MPRFNGPPYQDHLPLELRCRTAEERARLLAQAPQTEVHPPPRPGYGTVWVMPPDDDDVWSGSWQDDGDRVSDVEGSYQQVREWVESRPAAAKVIFIATLDQHIAVDDAAWTKALQGGEGSAPANFHR